MKYLKREVLEVGSLIEDAIDREVLSADVGAQVGPRRVVGIGGRLDRIGPDMAEPARHTHAVGSDERLVLVVCPVGVIALRVPALGRLFVELRVRKEAQANDARGIAVKRSSVEGLAVQRLASRARPDAGILRRVLEWIGRTVRLALIDPQIPTRRVGCRRLGEARLVDEAEVIPPGGPAVTLRRMGRHDFEKVERAPAGLAQRVPQPIVPGAPHDPRIAAANLVDRESDGTVAVLIHLAEIVLIGRRER